MSKILEKLDLTGIESWTEQQQCSVMKLLEKYQHLFALNLKELGKTSLVQHEIRLSNNTPFKERYRRIPPHQCEEVRVILACHDDNGLLGMEWTLGLLQERFFWPKMVEDVQTHICTCERCLRFKQPQEKAEIKPILVSYPMELVHLDFLTLGEKAGDAKSTNILVITDHFTKYAQAYVTPKQTAVIVSLPCGRISWYIMDGQRKSLLNKENPLRITCFENYVV